MLSGMSVYSIDLRRKVMAALAHGGSLPATAQRFDVHPTTVRRWRRQAAAGQLEPRRGGAPPTPTKLTPQDLLLLERQVQARPGVTLRELAGMVSVAVAESTICRALKKLGYRYKKSRWSRGNGSGPTCSGGG